MVALDRSRSLSMYSSDGGHMHVVLLLPPLWPILRPVSLATAMSPTKIENVDSMDPLDRASLAQPTNNCDVSWSYRSFKNHTPQQSTSSPRSQPQKSRSSSKYTRRQQSGDERPHALTTSPSTRSLLCWPPPWHPASQSHCPSRSCDPRSTSCGKSCCAGF